MSKIAVVTGASRGMGAVTARLLADDGYVVAVHFGRSADEADGVVNAIEAAGGKAFAFGADLSEPGDGSAFWQAYDEAASAAGEAGEPVFALVNNAGAYIPGPIDALAVENLERQLAINTIAPYAIVRAGLNRFADGGRIVNISSGASQGAAPDALAYSMSKAAVNSFTVGLAKALGGRGITVNAVLPGVTMTDMNKEFFGSNEKARNGVIGGTALGRLGEPEDVAKVTRWLVSEDAGWVTGQLIGASGGLGL